MGILFKCTLTEKYWRGCALTTKRLIMDSKELLEKAKQAYYNVQHKEYTKRSFIAGYLIGYAEQLCKHDVVGRSECPHDGTIQQGINERIEEIELPSEEDIEENLLEQGTIANYALYQAGYEEGVNFILNKLKGETK